MSTKPGTRGVKATSGEWSLKLLPKSSFLADYTLFLTDYRIVLKFYFLVGGVSNLKFGF